MLAYLHLLRLPTVFTAMADIMLGYVLTHQYIYGPLPGGTESNSAVGWNHPEQFFGLLAASCCLYLSGMVFNDVFDVAQDTIERPRRPIPSGRVSRQSATLMGAALMLIGISLAGLVGPVSFEVAMLLVVAILGYDAILKRTPLGPLAMGSCRFLNVLLGASVQPNWVPSLLSHPQLAAALGLGIYIAGVTLFARTEARTSNRWQLAVADVVINTGFLVHAGLMIFRPTTSIPVTPLAILMVIAFTVNRRALDAIRDPSPAKVQTGIKVMLLSLVLIDATLVFWHLNSPAAGNFAAGHAMATALLLIPAMYLGRLIPMT